VSTHESYPPITDEAAETRRVEETLKRWELAERQRRKSARESVHHSPGPSLFASVTRTASLVLAGRSSVGSTAANPGSSTRPFKSHDTVDVTREGYGVPLDDIDHANPPMDVAVHSPSPSVLERDASIDTTDWTGKESAVTSGLRTSENPFEHPSERSTRTRSPTTPTRASMSPPPISSRTLLSTTSPTMLSPFADVHAQVEYSKTHARKRSSGGRPAVVPPPCPLGLPPPPEDIPHATPLQPTLQPVLVPPPRTDPEERQEVRWWHEWLCGCGEGPDRGGDHQAGRTNPFE